MDQHWSFSSCPSQVAVAGSPVMEKKAGGVIPFFVVVEQEDQDSIAFSLLVLGSSWHIWRTKL